MTEEMEQKEEGSWITFEDGSFISKRNWKIRNLTRITMILGIFSVGFIAIGYLVISTNYTEFLQVVGILGLLLISFIIAKGLGNKIFHSKMNDLLIHFKDDWRPNGVTRFET